MNSGSGEPLFPCGCHLCFSYGWSVNHAGGVIDLTSDADSTSGGNSRPNCAGTTVVSPNSLGSLVFLKPQWLGSTLAAVVTVADNPYLPASLKERGELHYADLGRVWQPTRSYPPPLRATLLELLHAREVAFPVRDAGGSSLGYSLVPAMLPEADPTDVIYAWRKRVTAEMGRIRVSEHTDTVVQPTTSPSSHVVLDASPASMCHPLLHVRASSWCGASLPDTSAQYWVCGKDVAAWRGLSNTEWQRRCRSRLTVWHGCGGTVFLDSDTSTAPCIVCSGCTA